MFPSNGYYQNVFRTKGSENTIVFKKVVLCLTLPQLRGKLRQTREIKGVNWSTYFFHSETTITTHVVTVWILTASLTTTQSRTNVGLVTESWSMYISWRKCKWCLQWQNSALGRCYNVVHDCIRANNHVCMMLWSWNMAFMFYMLLGGSKPLSECDYTVTMVMCVDWLQNKRAHPHVCMMIWCWDEIIHEVIWWLGCSKWLLGLG